MPLTLEIRETVAAPPARVFEAMTDLDSLGKWMHGLLGVERLAGEGPLAVGHRFRETRRMMGHTASEVFEVTGMVPGRSMDLFVDGRQGSTGKGEFRFRHEVRPAGSGSEIVLSGEISGMGAMGEFLGRLFLGTMRKAIAKDLASLKAFVEGGEG